MKNDNGKRNYRHCDAKCCFDCKWFDRFHGDTFCEHPKNVCCATDVEFVMRPSPHMICDWWERKEDGE